MQRPRRAAIIGATEGRWGCEPDARIEREARELVRMAGGFKAELTGCFSTPCDDNPTVVMLEAAFRHRGLNWRYINAEVQPAGLAAAVAGARAMGWRGFNLSMPHKVEVIRHLDGLGESAKVIGAVNCVIRRGEKLVGENTDGKGFLSSLEPVRDPRGTPASLSCRAIRHLRPKSSVGLRSMP